MEPTILNQRYRLVELVGTGGMATVFRGQDLLLERIIAVKFLREPYASDPTFHQRFMEEARAAARLDHPNIVRIYDVGEDEHGHPYIVMEMVEGEDLKSLFKRFAPLQVSQALNLTRQICAGVGHAHRAGIVHCDLKPQNILVTPEGQIKVADFGIARALQTEDADAQPEAIVWGSPHYISPERAAGKAPVAASDVYSIGVILYEMLTGVPPFHDPDPTQLALKHLREEPAPISSLNPRTPPGLEWLIKKVLDKEPSNRYRNADQLGMAIDEYQRQGEGMTVAQAPAAPVVQLNKLASPAPVSMSHAAPAPSVAKISPAHESPDFMLWALMAIAAIAVVGLLPLWIFVYQVYMPTPPTTTPATKQPTPTATVVEMMVSVPNLVGFSASDAQRMVESLNLKLEVIGEEESATARPGAVLQHTPTAGSRVPAGATISVILASGRTFTMPDVLRYDLETVRAGLESEGLFLRVEEIWSTETKGVILQQIPLGGIAIRAGDTVTLTISGGINRPLPLQVNLNQQVLLEAALVSQLDFRPGDTIPLTLRWRCTQPLDRPYKVFVHLLNLDMNTLIAQHDTEPVNGLRPTTSWAANEVINDPHQLAVPAGTPPGKYQIRVGLYNAEGRLPVVDMGETEVIDNTIFVTYVEIKP
ncbi:MAG TPA: protein kinase [Anaerolineae bacterium]|nr:protein kinase [Anaerolineae bacterium]